MIKLLEKNVRSALQPTKLQNGDIESTCDRSYENVSRKLRKLRIRRVYAIFARRRSKLKTERVLMEKLAEKEDDLPGKRLLRVLTKQKSNLFR